MSELVDFTGQKIGSFKVIDRNFDYDKSTPHSSEAMWNCICECGEKEVKFRYQLLNGMNSNNFKCQKCVEKKDIIEYNPIIKKKGVIDYTGTKVNSFLVKEKVKLSGNDRHISYLCECEICGHQIIRKSSRIATAKFKCKKCKENNKKREYKPRLKARGNQEQIAFNSLYKSYKESAKKRGFAFELSKEEFKLLTSQNCYYCNNIPSNISKSNLGGIYKYNGIDRIDNNTGYEFDNCTTCCKKCNYMKHTSSIEDFQQHIIKIYENLLLNNK